MPQTGQPSQERVAALGRSIAMLDVLAESGPLGTNDIARRVGTAPSTVSRQLGTLVEARLVEHTVDDGKYRLGIRLVELANAVLARLDIRAVARPHLGALVAEFDEAATLSIPGEFDAVTVDFVRSPHFVQGTTTIGRPSIGHATAAGKVMLACTGREPRLPLHAYTDHTITDLVVLREELELVRSRGHAYGFEERERDLNAVAAPVWLGDAELAGIVTVHGPASRFGRSAARRALPALLEHTEAMSKELGATPRAIVLRTAALPKRKSRSDT
jgi:DNA-binding IclR family transcriptional regulator